MENVISDEAINNAIYTYALDKVAIEDAIYDTDDDNAIDQYHELENEMLGMEQATAKNRFADMTPDDVDEAIHEYELEYQEHKCWAYDDDTKVLGDILVQDYIVVCDIREFLIQDGQLSRESFNASLNSMVAQMQDDFLSNEDFQKDVETRKKQLLDYLTKQDK